MYLGRPQMFFAAELVATQVGAARAALEEYEVLMRTENTSMPPVTAWPDSDLHHLRYGTILSLTDAAEELLLAAARRVTELMTRWAATARSSGPPGTRGCRRWSVTRDGWPTRRSTSR